MYSQKVIDTARDRLERKLKHPLIEYTPTQVTDRLFEMRAVDWSDGVNATVLRLLPEQQEFITNELLMSKINFRYWCERYAKIQNDAGQLVHLIPWPSQQKILKLLGELEERVPAGDPVKIALIILKARQIGGTALAEALVAHQVFFSTGTRGGIASDHPDNSKNLWDVFTRMYDHLPPWMKPRSDARAKATNLHLPDLDADVMVGAGNQKTTFGQGVTMDVGHMTELSTWLKDNCDQLEKDLIPAWRSSKKHHSMLLYESTAEGASGNYFHDTFQSARKGSSFFTPIFLGWHSAPDKYTADPSGVSLDEDTLNVAKRILADDGVELSKGQLAWFQITKSHYEALGRGWIMSQEYPSTPDEAFQTGHKSVFPLDVRLKVRARAKSPIAILEWVPEIKKFEAVDDRTLLGRAEMDAKLYNNKLLIFEKARPGYVYVCAVDVSYGLDQDSSAIEIIRVGNRLEPAEQVAEFATNTLDPVQLTDPTEWLGKYYESNNRPAVMAIESNPGSPGIVTQTQLLQRGYPNFYVWRKPTAAGSGGWKNEVGWHTTNVTRPLLTNTGVNAITAGKLLINSSALCKEMDTFVYVFSEATQNKKMEHAPGNCDDRIIGAFIGYYVGHEAGTSKIAASALEGQIEKQRPTDEVIQFQALGINYEDALAQWEERYL
jgi:hypothetical protein